MHRKLIWQHLLYILLIGFLAFIKMFRNLFLQFNMLLYPSFFMRQFYEGTRGIRMCKRKGGWRTENLREYPHKIAIFGLVLDYDPLLCTDCSAWRQECKSISCSSHRLCHFLSWFQGDIESSGHCGEGGENA